MRRTTVAMIGAGLLALSLAACSEPAQEPVQAPVSQVQRVVMETAAGRIVIEVDADRAPLSSCNFLNYAHDGAYDGGSFFRTVRRDRPNGNPNPIDVIQAQTPKGSDDPGNGPVALERTRDTGLTHVAGAVSMARDGPDTATSSFFIVIEDTPSLDFGGARNPDGQGFAVFGRVVEGMDVARRIQMMRADRKEQIQPPVLIRSARLEGPMLAQCHP